VLHRLFRHLRILWRVEATIAEARLHLTVRRSVLYAVAGLIAVFGLGMLNVAVFFAFASHWGPIWAAMFAAGGDFVLAIAVAALAFGTKSAAHVNNAIELRQTALDGIDAEFSGLQEPFAWLGRATRYPIDTALPAAIVPLLTAIIRTLRKSKTDPAPPAGTESQV
jgi:hypothetical protein